MQIEVDTFKMLADSASVQQCQKSSSLLKGAFASCVSVSEKPVDTARTLNFVCFHFSTATIVLESRNLPSCKSVQIDVAFLILQINYEYEQVSFKIVAM